MIPRSAESGPPAEAVNAKVRRLRSSRARAAAAQGLRAGFPARHFAPERTIHPGDPSLGILSAYGNGEDRFSASDVRRMIVGDADERFPFEHYSAFEYRAEQAGLPRSTAQDLLKIVKGEPSGLIDYRPRSPPKPGSFPYWLDLSAHELLPTAGGDPQVYPSFSDTAGNRIHFASSEMGGLEVRIEETPGSAEFRQSVDGVAARYLLYHILRATHLTNWTRVPEDRPLTPALQELIRLNEHWGSPVEDSIRRGMRKAFDPIYLAEFHPVEAQKDESGIFESYQVIQPGGASDRVEFLQNRLPGRTPNAHFLTLPQVLLGAIAHPVTHGFLRANVIDKRGKATGFRLLGRNAIGAYRDEVEAVNLRAALDAERTPGTQALLEKLKEIGIPSSS